MGKIEKVKERHFDDGLRYDLDEVVERLNEVITYLNQIGSLDDTEL